MMTNYLDLSQLDGGHLFKMIGELPFELVSVSDSIVYTDKEGLQSAAHLVDKIG
jgi:hypothetical protein